MLSRVQACAHEGDSRDLELIKAHDSPWAFDDEARLSEPWFDTVDVEQELLCGEFCRELPLSVPDNLIVVEPSTRVSDGRAIGQEEADSDATFEPSVPRIEAGAEDECGVMVDAFAHQEVTVIVKVQGAGEGPKRPVVV